MNFKLISDFRPAGDQPEAIRGLLAGLKAGARDQILLGVTGSGKTFTLANVIAEYNRPTLVIAPNKTLASQLYAEFRTFFPENAVEYFVSYYDYYQPEAYVPKTDTYIEKDASINDRIDRMRHAATRALFERKDVIIVASVSCIYGLGSAEAYMEMLLFIEQDQEISREDVLKKLVEIQYSRNDYDFQRGTFRVRGDTVDIFPSWEEDTAIRLMFFGDQIEKIIEIDPLTGYEKNPLDRIGIYPNSHYVVSEQTLNHAIESVKNELVVRLKELRDHEKLLEAQRLDQRTMYDLEMLQQIGYCSGIENYSRHFTGRKEGEPPPTLLDYFPEDYLQIIDESHIAVPQLIGMYRGDRTRKETLVEYGFRLPSALDNRPLRFDEFNSHLKRVIYTSATPGDYELALPGRVVVEQIVRPTGLVDPCIEVRPIDSQVDDLLHEIRLRTKKNERALVTTLTKRMAEHLTEYYRELSVKVEYLHSDIDTLERIKIIRDFRLGKFDCLIGINLLREGLDLPEVSLVAILDADKEGFLRAARSLIQTFGRAARNINGNVIMYADNITASMKQAIDESDRRRRVQIKFNELHNINPKSIERKVHFVEEFEENAQIAKIHVIGEKKAEYMTLEEIKKLIGRLKAEMIRAASNLDFEQAAGLRDRIRALEKMDLVLK
jgi:excinuclease ABC subunit B